jgi:hypothetical protein
MKFRVLFVCTVLAGCQVESLDEVADEIDLEAIARQNKVTICHKPNGANPHTLEVAGPAVNAHLGHGDYLGACQPVVCEPGATASCYDGPSGTEGVGTCVAGTQTCNEHGTAYGTCSGAVTPASETCGDGLDNDCDGVSDDSCVCAPGSMASCYAGPTGTAGVGTCAEGTQTCNATGTGYGACVDSVEPVAEVCGDGLDNNCDGVTDDGCVCTPSAVTLCYEGPAYTVGVGTCREGTQTCNATGTEISACTGSVEPVTEVCNDGLDNDCNGTVDNGCVCVPNSQTSCYAGPAGTAGVGICVAGTQTCDATGMGQTECQGSVEPEADVCGDGLDNNCDGTVDDGCCVPSEELCGDGLDNDCDGLTDETCVCTPASTQACYSGPPGTNGVGVCHAGTRTCNAGGTGYGACTGQVTPGAEACGNGLDDDCDGSVDEGCLGDRAWNDRNRNGIQDADESGLGGATYILRTSTGALVSVAVSAASGVYWFTNIPPGTYYIEVIPPFSYTLSGADLGTDDTLDNDFDGESGATTIFSYSGNQESTWDAGFFFVIQT